MKNSFLLLLLFTAMGKAQTVTIPDANFKAALLAPTSAENGLGVAVTTVDTNSDGEIQLSEALDVVKLNINSANISDLSGIAQFTNLKELKCDDNQITSLDATGVLALENLSIRDNLLTYLDVSGLPALINVDFTGNINLLHLDLSDCPSMGGNLYTQTSLTYLDVSNSGFLVLYTQSPNLTFVNFDGCLSLNEIRIEYSLLTGVNVHDLPSLVSLTFRNNSNLSSIIVTNCPMVSDFWTSDNNISILDVSTMPALQFLWCANNKLTTLDASSLSHLWELNVANNLLETLYVKNGNHETFTTVEGNPNLAFICADEDDISAIQTSLIDAGMTNTVCNSYCNFNPGGPYNTITGSLKLDADNNGCDVADVNPVNVRIDINDGTAVNTVFVNTIGGYRIYTGAGNFTLTPSVENPSYFNFSPATANASFPDSNSNTAIKNFCVTPVGSHQDLEIVIAPIVRARPGFDATYRIIYRNKGNFPISELYGITFFYNENLMDFVSASEISSSAGPGALTWDYTNLLPFESRSILVTMHVNSPADANPVNVNDVLQLTSAILPSAADENNADNIFQFNQTVVGSYDPNDITCIEGDVVSPATIGDYLHYVINFENTGTDAAENIVVRTTINPAQFDLHSLQLLHTSHLVDARITGNVLEFIFENIELPIGGHGHILLKIKTNSILATGDSVSKRADIFFDYNMPVDTGLANTIFQNLSNTQFEVDSSVVVSPNPANNEVTIKAANTIQSIQLFDVQGRIILTSVVGETESKLNISGYANGIFFIKIITEKGIKIQKLLKN